MKNRIIFLVFIVLTISCKRNSYKDNGSKFIEKSMTDTTIIVNDQINEKNKKEVNLINSGKYKAIDEDGNIEKEDCAIEIKIDENAKYTITVEGVQKKQGVYTVSVDDGNIYVNFENIEGMYYNDTIVVQNYGNAMNEYNYFDSCDKKYIYFVKGNADK